MTTKELSEYGKIKREIKMLERRIADLQSQESEFVSDAVSGSSLTFPYVKRTIVITGFDTSKDEKLSKLKERLTNRKSRLNDEMEKIETFIDTVDNSEMRQILTYRYINGYSWQRVAFSIGHHDEQYPRRKNNKFLRKNKK